MDPHPGFGPRDQELIDRLYTTHIHITRAARKAAIAEEYKAPEPPALDAMRRANKDALISRVSTAHSHGSRTTPTTTRPSNCSTGDRSRSRAACWSARRRGVS